MGHVPEVWEPYPIGGSSVTELRAGMRIRTTLGVYTVSLVIKDSNNVYDLKTTTITVVNYYPNAVAGSDRTVAEDEVVNFDASDSYDKNDDIASYEWNFGDGSTAAGLQTSHVYEDEGTYHVTLTVTDNDEAFDMDVITITVDNEVPTANGIANGELDDDLTITEDDAVTFDGSLSTDTASDLPNLRYAWDFGEGSKGYGQTTSHTYSKQGVYYATMRVTDDNAAYTEDTIAITVVNSPPVADAGPDQIVDEGDTVYFDGTTSSDTPSDEPLLEYDWTFGGKGTNPTYNWYDDSIYDIELTVTDDDGLESKDMTTINIKNVAPTASIDGAYVMVDFRLRAAGKKWQAVDLKVTEPGKEVTSIGIVRYPGSPDDQAVTAEDVKINIAEDVTATVYYTPKANGATPTWLTLTFEDGTSKTLFRSFNNQKPDEWVWVHDMNEHISGKPIRFEGSVYDPGTDDIDVTWNFGDGSAPISTHYSSNGNHPMQIKEHYVHTFAYGVYVVSLQAVDDDAGEISMTLTVTNTERLTSTNIAPKVSSSGGKTVLEDESFTLTGVGEDTGSDQGILTYTWYLGPKPGHIILRSLLPMMRAG
jgi:PKD repeat protein